MVMAVAAEQALKGRHIIKSSGTGEEHWRTDFIGRRTPDQSSAQPQAFLIEMRADETILPHFHEVDQFQVFVAGSGGLGRHEVPTVAVHYTDHHTGYGPITAGPRGYSYFTLRARSDPGARYLHLPGYREALKPSRKRHGTTGGLQLSTVPVLTARTGIEIEPLLTELKADDGLHGALYRLGPEMSATGPQPAASGGQYWLVLNGSLIWEGARHGPWSVVFVAPADPAFRVQAGPDGLEALLLQYPRREAQP